MNKQKENKTKVKPQKLLAPTGYSLHAQRLNYTGYRNDKDLVKRAIKYPILSSNPDSNNLLAQVVKHDYDLQNGAINLNTWMNSETYSLLDFWIDCLRVGGFFCSTAARLVSRVEFLENLNSSEALFNNLGNLFKDRLDTEALKNEVVLKKQWRGKRENSEAQELLRFEKKILRLFLKKHHEDNDIIAFSKNHASLLLNSSPADRPVKLLLSLGLKESDLKNNQSRENKDDLTFYIDSNLTFNANLTSKELFTRLISPDSSVAELVGIANKGNAFSNFFTFFIPKLLSSSTEEMLQYFLQFSDTWKDEEQELHRRLDFLKKKVRLLDHTLLVTCFADYRSQFCGKLSSWYSNYLNREKELKDTREDHLKFFDSLDTLIQEREVLAQGSEYKERVAELKKETEFYVESMQKILNQSETAISDNFEVYSGLLAGLRSSLNFLFQQSNLFSQEKEEAAKKKKKSKDEDNWEEVYIKDIPFLKPLFTEKLKKVPYFFGEAKKEQYSNFRKSGIAIEQSFGILKFVEESLLVSEKSTVEKDYFLKQLDTLVRKYWSLNSNLFKEKIKKTILNYTNEFPEYDFKKCSAKAVFLENAYTRRKHIRVLQLSSEFNFSSELDFLLKEYRASYNWKNLTNEQLIDLVEITKVGLGWVLKRYRGAVDFSSLNFSNFPAAQNYIKTFGATLSGRQLTYFVQSLICSQLKGSANLITRKEIIVRSHLQPTDSSKSILPFYVENIAGKTKYGYYAKTLKELSGGEEKEVTLFAKKDDKVGKIEKIPAAATFEICTSKYQLQFIEWWLKKDSYKNITLERNDPALVLEEKFKIIWNEEKTEFTLEKGEQQLFVVQPFDFIPQTERTKQQEKLKNRNLYLGVDVGEYGLAWVVADFSERGKDVLVDKGFIYENRIAKVREYRGLLKEQQVKGTFSITSTALARQREQAIGALQNKVHALALKYNAKPCYEFQISNFETGSNRVSALYKSVKKADVKGSNDADKGFKKNIWGSASLNVGSEISAYATSQTCSECGKSVLGVLEKDQEYTITKVEGKIAFLNTSAGSVKIFLDRETVATHDKIKGSVAQKLAYAYMRPPADSAHLQKPRMDNPLSALFLKRRGNSAVFICPFCDHISDADIQAALNIAFKRYIKDIHLQKNSGSKENPDFFKEVFGKVESCDYPVIGFESYI